MSKEKVKTYSELKSKPMFLALNWMREVSKAQI